MNFVHDGLAAEFEHVTREGERQHIGGLFDSGDALMQETLRTIDAAAEIDTAEQDEASA